MPYCYAPGCNHNSRRETCSFFRFPADTRLFEEWKALCPRNKEKEPTNEDRLCSCHFIDGDKVNLPTVFAHSNASSETIVDEYVTLKYDTFTCSSTPKTRATPIGLMDQQPTKPDEWECRACLEKVGSSNSLVNLFEAWSSPWEGMESTVAQDLAKVGHIKLSSADGHSKFICQTCYTKLHNACNFAAVVQKSDRILRQRYPQTELDPGDATWPKPIQLDQNINDTVYETAMDIEIKQEVMSDNEYAENLENGISDIQYKDLEDVEIKIEPEELMKPQAIKINGAFSYMEGTEHFIQPNANEMLEEFLDAPLKEEPTSEIDSDPVTPTDLPLECMLCAKSFHSVSGLKAHVIAQHSYKSVKRKTGGKQSPQKDKFVCSTCRRSFVTSTDLMVHETCHNKAICYGCNQKFDTFDQLSRHRVRCKVITTKDLPKPKTLDDVKRIIAEEHKSTEDEDLPKEQLECHLCTEKFSDSYYMRIHQEIHHSSEQVEPAPAPPPEADAVGMDLESIFSEDK